MLGLKREVPCPYCYRPVDPSKPAFRCSGRAAPGRTACQKKEDSTRVDVFSDATPVFPALPVETKAGFGGNRVSAECPECGGPTGIRLCPMCHSVFPANFTSESSLVGIVGVRGSGKTVMLSVLAKEMTTSIARRFNASIDAVGSSQLLVRLDNVRKNLDGGTQHLPDQTARFSLSETVPAVFEWQIAKQGLGIGNRTASTILSFYDASGEDLASLDVAREQHYLAAADGLILLLDPFGLPANRDTALARGVDEETLRDTPIKVLSFITDLLREAERLGANKRIKRPLAVVLAKIDAFYPQVDADHPIRRPADSRPVFNEKESADLHHHVESLVSRWGGDDVLAKLRLNYQTYRFFVASALGAEPEYSTGRVNSKGVLPHRVGEPLLWLMSRRKFIPMEK